MKMLRCGFLGMGALSASLVAVGCKPAAKMEELKERDYVLEDSGDPISAENPQTVRGNHFEDFYGAFTLDRPNSDWDFLTAEKAKALNPDAVMGMVCPSKGGFIAVIPERLEGATLDDYIGLALDPESPLGASMPTPEVFEIGELEAQLVETTANVGGTNYTYQIAFVRRGDFYYQILGWGSAARFPIIREEMKSALRSFRIVESREPSIRANLSNPDVDGFGWQVRNGTYRNAVGGFQIACPEGCRFIGVAELAASSEGACAGINGASGNFYQQWYMEQCPDESLMNAQVEATIGGLGGERGASRQVEIGGVEATEITLDKVEFNGIALDYRVAWFRKGAFLYRVLSWWLPDSEDESKATLERSYSSVAWVDETKRTAWLADVRDADPGNAVGTDYAMRNGTFYDFAHGYTLALPGAGNFETLTAATSSEEEMDGDRVTFTNLDTGTYFMLSGTKLAGESHSEFHEAEVAIDGAEDVQKRQVGKHDFLITHYSSELDGVTYRHALASAAKGDRIVSLWATHAGVGRVNELDRDIDQVAAGLEIFDKGLPDRSQTRRSKIDHRLGYSVDVPPGWKIEQGSMGEMDAISSQLTMEKPKTMALFLAMCSPLGVDLELASGAMLQKTGVKFDGASEKRTKSKLAGHDAERLSVRGLMGRKKVKVDCWTMLRGNTGYIVFVLDDENSKSVGAEKIAAYLKLID